MIQHRFNPFYNVILLSAVTTLLFACNPDEENNATQGQEDMTMATDMADMPVINEDMPADMVDMPTEDMPGDQGTDQGMDMPDDMEVDMTEPPTCDAFAAPSLGTFEGAIQRAANPSKCQQPAYTWLEDATLGDVTQQGEVTTYTTPVLNAIATGAGVELPLELEYDVNVRVVEYVTQDRGELTTATTFVAAPTPKAGQEQNFKTLVFLHGTSGFTDGCGPSSDSETLLLASAIASTGFVVVGPDYLGLKGIGDASEELHPYLVGESVAMTSIDALRAVGKLGLFEEQGACASSEILVLGGSQGGHAALWFDRMLPYYAPEFELLGTVATVPPADLIGQSKRALTSPVQASANVIAFWTTASYWYGLGDKLAEVFVSPYDVDVSAAMRMSCDPSDNIDLDSFTDLGDVFTQDALSWKDDLAAQPTWGCIIEENGVTTTSLPRIDDSASYADTYGIYWIMGEEDNLVNTPIERGSFETLCEQGMPMQYLECAGASHTKATAWSLPEILTFLTERGERQPMPTVEEGLCQLTAPQTCSATPVE